MKSIIVNENDQAQDGQNLSITQMYSDQDSFIHFLQRIGVTDAARN